MHSMDKIDSKIGIVGGAGPYAGLDCALKILQQTKAEKDQDYLPTLLISTPGLIEDRTSFLLGKSSKNPAHAIFTNLLNLRDQGATVIGIPCNTAHAPVIKDVFVKKLNESKNKPNVLDMISETAKFLKKECPQVKTVGILSTIGTWKAGFYPDYLRRYGYDVCILEERLQENLHNEALYHPEYGIKVQANPVTKKARSILLEGFDSLSRKGAEAIILGCTEIPIGIPERKIGNIFCIDTSLILARALINEFRPEKLVSWSWNI